MSRLASLSLLASLFAFLSCAAPPAPPPPTPPTPPTPPAPVPPEPPPPPYVPNASAPEAESAAASVEGCTEAVYAEFDFWVGDWEVRTAEGELAGHNTITKLHDGCALLEQWRSAKGASGTSTNQWVAARGRWVQHWVDASGAAIDLEGGLEAEVMVLTGDYQQKDGTTLRMRGSWSQLEDGRVRQFFEVSEDGATWQPAFEGFYARR